MTRMFTLLSFIGTFLASTRNASATQCTVSLPQKSTPVCKAVRDKELAVKRGIFTLKENPQLDGYAMLNMTPQEFVAVSQQDTFTRYFIAAFFQMSTASENTAKAYNSLTAGQEIANISEYLQLSTFFESAMEQAIGEYGRLPSRYEAFNNNKPEWISDKLFTQQRLAGTNPMSIRRVTIQERRCTVKTTDGKWCHFPFFVFGKKYDQCIGRIPWCSTTRVYRGWRRFCKVNNDTTKGTDDCTVQTVIGEWCHFPFTYKGKVYKGCTDVDHNRPWCSTTKNYDQDGFWGNCATRTFEENKIEGLDWNELKAVLDPLFDWEAAVQATLRTAVSLKKAIKEGLVYALRYELCDDMLRIADLTDTDPRRTMWNFLSPIALFASAKVAGKGQNELVPVAIQMDSKPGSKVYTPNDGDNWLIAKLNVQITDLGYSQIVEHLSKVHFLMEPFCVSLKRTLPGLHPLNQILKYHCREISLPNVLVPPSLFGQGTFLDLLFANGNAGSQRLVGDAHKFVTWEVTDLREQIEKRGLADKRLVPYFPYRDDSEKIVKIIERMATSYVKLYYKSNKDAEEDSELQAFANEVSANGTGPTGGIGKIEGFPASIKSKEELVDILSRIISQLSVQHAAVNYELIDYVTYAPNLPTKLYNDTRVNEGEFSFLRLPNRLTSSFAGRFSNVLASFRFDSLFDYGNELQDIEAVNIVNRYYQDLMRIVQPQLQETNRKRKENGDLTYPYMIPRWIPNGVQT